MIEKFTYRLDAALVKDIMAIATEQRTSTSKVVQDALKLYRDAHYMDFKATFLSREILSTLQSTVDAMEHRINNRSNQLLSSMAIQQFIIAKVLADNLNLSPDALELYRAQSVEFMRTNNRILNLKEMIE